MEPRKPKGYPDAKINVSHLTYPELDGSTVTTWGWSAEIGPASIYSKRYDSEAEAIKAWNRMVSKLEAGGSGKELAEDLAMVAFSAETDVKESEQRLTSGKSGNLKAMCEEHAKLAASLERLSGRIRMLQRMIEKGSR